jgi:recombination associated protein RdgC
MWFNNALIYQCTLPDNTNLNDLLQADALKPCPPHARFIYGWLPVINDIFAETISGASLIALGKEERILPRKVITRLLTEQVQALEMQRGYPVKRAEKAQLAEELEFQLLPKAFCLQKRLPAFFDESNNRLVINSSSATQASQLTSLLRKAVPGIQIEPLLPKNHLSATLTSWITHPETLPPSIELASNCVLVALNDEKKRLQCKGYELPSQEISHLLEQGLAVSEISLIWQERIEFTLTQDFTFKRVRCLDYLLDELNDIRHLEEEHAQQDAALALLAGEWRALLTELMHVFSISETNARLTQQDVHSEGLTKHEEELAF